MTRKPIGVTVPYRLLEKKEKRKWVGLTEAEVDKCYESIMFHPDIEPTRMGVYLEIEARLKELNT